MPRPARGERPIWSCSPIAVATLMILFATTALTLVIPSPRGVGNGFIRMDGDSAYQPPFNPAGIACPSVSVCEAVGNSAADQGAAMGTTDGGTNWTTQTLPSGVFDVSGVACPSTNVCEAAAAPADGVEGGIVLGTTDGGSTWTTQTLPSGAGGISDIVCPSTNVCEAAGGNGSDGAIALGTINGGSTWTIQTLPVRGIYGLSDIVCPSTTVCEAAGFTAEAEVADVIVGTTNGGTTWVTQTIPSGIAFIAYLDLACPSASVCEAVGGNDSGGAVVLGTTNSGTTWTTQTVPSSIYDVSEVVCPVHRHLRGGGRKRFQPRYRAWHH